MIFPTIAELSVVTVLDRGIPNRECVAIQANEPVDLGRVGIMLGVFGTNQMALPIQDQLFWFGDGNIQAGDWIFVNTGDGEPRFGKTNDDKNNVYTVFWKKSKTLFANSNIVPILFRIDAVQVFLPQTDVPQIGHG